MSASPLYLAATVLALGLIPLYSGNIHSLLGKHSVGKIKCKFKVKERGRERAVDEANRNRW